MKINKYLLAARPKTLLVSFGSVLVGLSLSGLDKVIDQKSTAIAIVVCALSLQIAANLSNDYFDYKNKIDGENRLGPKRISLQFLSPQEVKIAFTTSFVVSILLGAYLAFYGGLSILIIGVLSLLFAYLYTGGPYPLSYFGFGEILALIFFGPVAVWGTWFLMTEKMVILPAIVGLGPGFIAWSLMAVNNMRDRKSDKKAHKKTLAVLVDEKPARYIAIFGIVISVFLPIYLFFLYDNSLLLVSSFVFILFLYDWKRVLVGPVDKSQNKSLDAVSYYLFLYCTVQSLGFLASSL